MSSPDDARPEGPPPGDVAPVESEPVGAEVAQPAAAADDPRGDELRSDTEGTNPPDEGPQQDVDPGTPEGAGTQEPKPAATAPAAADPAGSTPEQPGAAEPGPADVADAGSPTVPVAEPDPEPAPPLFDERRSPLLERLVERLGAGVVATEVIPGRDIWARVSVDAWAEAALVCRDHLGLTYFCFLNAIDWLPSPFGKSEDDSAPAEVDPTAPLEHGVTGGDTRFQVFARLEQPGTGLGLTLKVDVPDETLAVPTWTGAFAGANWHERETREMYGIDFPGHPYLVNLYLPGAFEGFPGRKDFPLLARMVKPWPGLVDVEPMPGETADPEAAEVAE